MQIINMELSETAGSSAIASYAEMPASFQLVSATVVNRSTIGADGTHFRTLIIADNGDNTICSVDTKAGWAAGTPVAFTMSNPEASVLTKGQRFKFYSTEGSGGKTVDCTVTLNLAAARG